MKLLRRYEEWTGAKVDEITSAEVKQTLRINTLRVVPKELLVRLNKKNIKLRKIPYLEYGYEYSADFSMGATPEYLQGFYYLQEAASQLSAQVLNPKENSHVLDMAAAPGSKTTQMAQMMNNTGVIMALDSNSFRLKSLQNNIQRCGVTNTIVYNKDARFAADLDQKFDYILLDAPCSGNYCIEPKYFELRTLNDIKERARLQQSLMKAAMQCLKPDGTLVYSTCSLEIEENEENVNWFLEKYSDMKQVNTGLEVGDEGINQSLSRRFWPHKTGTQGFFIAKFEKSTK